jgi:hypothetical protein
MEDGQRIDAQRGCPHVNTNDARCGSRFSLGRLDQAFCVCFGAYHACPMYHQINAEAAEVQRAARAAVPVVMVTIDGIDAPLRATGS